MAAKSQKAVKVGTEYTVFKEAEGKYEPMGVAKGRRGDEAIKAFTKQENGTHKAGLWHAFPSSTVNADANTLEIVTETKAVSSFKRRSTNGAKPKAD